MFFNFDRRYLYIFLGIVIAYTLIGYITNPANLLELLLGIPGVLVAITFHEYAHALAAYKLGDDTAKQQGRLTLNPFKHTDPIGILMLLFLGFGWGRPVQIDSRNLNRKMSVSKATAIISFAGPAANFILAVLFSIITALALKFGWLDAIDSRAANTIVEILATTIRVNIGLGVFNLIPLPPLDGSKILAHFLPFKAREWFESNEQIFYFIFLFIWITGFAGTIIAPAIKIISKALSDLILTIVGL